MIIITGIAAVGDSDCDGESILYGIILYGTVSYCNVEHNVEPWKRSF